MKIRQLQSYLLNPKLSFPFILVSASTLRILGIGARPIWYDEAFAILFSRSGPKAMLWGTLTQDVSGAAADIHPIGYYSVLWAWMRLFGSSLFSVRLLSILFGVCTILLVYFLIREMFSIKVATVASLFLAISPFQIHYSQEVRMYSMDSFFLLLATYAMWKTRLTRKYVWWIVLAFSSTAALYIHNLSAFYIIPLLCTPIFHKSKEQLKNLMFTGVAIFLLYLPWLIKLPVQLQKVNSNYWTKKPGFSHLLSTLLSFVTNLPLPGKDLIAGLFITLFLIVIGCWQTFYSYKHKSGSYKRGLWLAYLVVAPVLGMFIVSQWIPVFIERALLTSGVICLSWLAWAVFDTNVPGPVRQLCFIMFLISSVIGIRVHLTYTGFPYAQFTKIGEELSKQIQSGDMIVHSNKLSMLPLDYYFPELPQTYIADPPDSGSDTLALPTQAVLGLYALQSIEELPKDVYKVWFLIFTQAIEEYKTHGYAEHPQITALQTHFTLSGIQSWDDIVLYEFNAK